MTFSKISTFLVFFLLFSIKIVFFVLFFIYIYAFFLHNEVAMFRCDFQVDVTKRPTQMNLIIVDHACAEHDPLPPPSRRNCTGARCATCQMPTWTQIKLKILGLI